MGTDITQQDLEQIMAEHDSSNHGFICFHQFKNIFYDANDMGFKEKHSCW